jgi:hypothetical protein
MPGHLVARERRHWGHTSDDVRGDIVAQRNTDTSMVGTTSARECDGECKVGVYSFRTSEGATVERRGDENTSAYSVLVGRGAK